MAMIKRHSAAATFAVCFAFWWLLSDRYTALGLALAVVASALVARANRDFDVLPAALAAAPRLALYVPWLLAEIAVSAARVARLVLDPRLPIDPVVVRVPTPLQGDLARMVFGNSVTLTPGTVTLDVEGGTFVVHALTREGAAGLASGRLARRVARALGERE